MNGTAPPLMYEEVTFIFYSIDKTTGESGGMRWDSFLRKTHKSKLSILVISSSHFPCIISLTLNGKSILNLPKTEQRIKKSST